MLSAAAESFPRTSRLTCAADYRPVFQDNTRISDGCFTLLYKTRESAACKPRLGLAIAKKQLKRAVDRNRIKRLIRQSFRLHQNQLPAVDVVVMVRGKILQLNNQQVFDRLHNLWGRIQ